MIKKFYFFSLFAISTLAQADFCPCPGNFNLIHIGDPLSQILKTCCAPTSQKIYKQQPPVPQKWTYNVTPPTNPINSIQGSVELIVTFDETEKVTNITVNAQSLTNTNCGPSSTVSFDVSTPNTIQVGNTMKTVEAICGKPQFIQKGISPQNNPNAPTITELQYVGPPPITLVFENAILKEIQK
ncbi:MAG: hypothetical protein K0S27_999 [Gammaproteobacteria bacterium]|jgi:hypothetical protein|nr:hypothetical protein [Gammaproteobacteria bacterium]